MAVKGARRVRVRYTNHTKCLLCYLCCFAVPLLWQAAGLMLVYPYRLAGTAPSLAQNLAEAFPFLRELLSDATARSSAALAATPRELSDALAYRELIWRCALSVWELLAWLITLVLQLVWRVTNARGLMPAAGTRRAIRTYRLMMLVIWLVNLLAALAVWALGVRFIEGRTMWDYLVYFVAYALNALAALCCFRLAAPPVLSGRGAFFKRL